VIPRSLAQALVESSAADVELISTDISASTLKQPRSGNRDFSPRQIVKPLDLESSIVGCSGLSLALSFHHGLAGLLPWHIMPNLAVV
jgi:hypothetical protein